MGRVVLTFVGAALLARARLASCTSEQSTDSDRKLCGLILREVGPLANEPVVVTGVRCLARSRRLISSEGASAFFLRASNSAGSLLASPWLFKVLGSPNCASSFRPRCFNPSNFLI
jgi:hypothetical protein